MVPTPQPTPKTTYSSSSSRLYFAPSTAPFKGIARSRKRQGLEEESQIMAWHLPSKSSNSASEERRSPRRAGREVIEKDRPHKYRDDYPNYAWKLALLKESELKTKVVNGKTYHTCVRSTMRGLCIFQLAAVFILHRDQITWH
mmetsp:Transcript_1034/g.1692  ORF Transcript_1034/g.1692 Transcript_1034/m.1692 type:complete len:143 (+) Transcript_1034:551-979(+)